MVFDVQIDTRYAPMMLTHKTWITASAVVEPIPTVTPPTGDGIVDMGIATKSGGVITLGAMLANSVKLLPLLTGVDNVTGVMNVYGWELTAPGILGPTGLWVPTILAVFGNTAGLKVPVTSDVPTTDNSATVRFCDTISLTLGNANISNEILSDTSDRIGHIILDAKGSALLEVRLGTGGSATSCNCLVKVL
jgi:hypothetical protein